jgi:flavodoxin I
MNVIGASVALAADEGDQSREKDMTIRVIYGSDTGSTRQAAETIVARLPEARAIDVKSATTGDFEGCDLLILGSSTCGLGDLQEDWEEGLKRLGDAKLDHARVALFGTGDQATYGDSFVDALGTLYDTVTAKGATVVGFTDTAGYHYTASTAEREGRFVGLVIDNDNQGELTRKRIEAWVRQLQ